MLRATPPESLVLAAAVSPDPRLPDTEFSLAHRLDLSPRRCRALLDALVVAGVLERLGPSDAPAYVRPRRAPRGAA